MTRKIIATGRCPSCYLTWEKSKQEQDYWEEREKARRSMEE